MLSTNQISTVYQIPAHEIVADQLQRSILLGRFLPGYKLPPERTMAKKFGVSRTSVREAIHLLIDNGLIHVKRGATGGAFVKGILEKTIREPKSARTISERKDHKDLIDYRIVVECAAARLAATYRRKSDLQLLARHIRQIDTLTGQVNADCDAQTAILVDAYDAAFHSGIATASRNPHLLSSVEDCRYEIVMLFGHSGTATYQESNNMRRNIYKAIEAGDSGLSTELMEKHIRLSLV